MFGEGPHGNTRQQTYSSTPAWWEHTDGTVYVAVVRLDWGLTIWKIPRVGSPESFDIENVAGNPLDLPVLDVDSHKVITIAVSAQGYIYVEGNRHAVDTQMIRSTNPGDITSWTVCGNPAPDTAPVERGTYTHWRRAPNGDLLLWRHQRHAEYYETVPYGSHFALVRMPHDAATPESWENVLGPGVRWAMGEKDPVTGQWGYADLVYMGDAKYDRSGTLHAMFIWRYVGDGLLTSSLRPIYVRSHDDGATWENVVGVPVETPMRRGNTTHAQVANNDDHQFTCMNVCATDDGIPWLFVRRSGVTSIGHWDGSDWVWQTTLYGAAGTMFASGDDVWITFRSPTYGRAGLACLTRPVGNIWLGDMGLQNTPPVTEPIWSNYAQPQVEPNVAGHRGEVLHVTCEGDTPKLYRVLSRDSLVAAPDP